ncbi:MAG TPA: amylo-alpha-1,6-glucosidase, partial [Gemmatimonadales bacterium]|nr:amylo-alpha-1,6-glucosidase [Gemmatimonadales bacterium]
MNPLSEWLEADGLGGFASGTVTGIRTRRYHGLLLTAATPPTGRLMLVNGFDAWIARPESPERRVFLTRQRYRPGVTTECAPSTFAPEPWPTWRYELDDGLTIEFELLAPRGRAAVALAWRARNAPSGLRLVIRPFLSGRDAHALHHENAALDSGADVRCARVRWQPYPGTPAVLSSSNSTYFHDPVWYRGFELDEERARGFEHVEDCFSPGTLTSVLGAGESVWLLAAEGQAGAEDIVGRRPLEVFHRIREEELRRRSAFPSPLHRAADAYIVSRGSGQTIVAGYPWFTDWGRDTFIALRGLCLATGRLDDARDILLAWADTVSEGMVPNRFVDQGGAPEFNAVDASLWYVVAVHEFLKARAARRDGGDRPARAALEAAVLAIVAGYAGGTRYGIRADSDGLLACGTPGVQLTWMDARVGDQVITPRIGKPVEVQALWLNALRIAGGLESRWSVLNVRALRAFRRRFWNAERGCLFDVIDADHVPGRTDGSVRPNQIFAVGGLPFPVLAGDQARSVVQTVRQLLLTPLGLRSLAPEDDAYCPRYQGSPEARDGAYHQGTAWPWLSGAYGEACLRVQDDSDAAREQVRREVIAPLRRHLTEAGLGHVSEVADGDGPHRPGGCPFQAWSVGELLRL